jgi:hypothetical protein
MVLSTEPRSVPPKIPELLSISSKVDEIETTVKKTAQTVLTQEKFTALYNKIAFQQLCLSVLKVKTPNLDSKFEELRAKLANLKEQVLKLRPEVNLPPATGAP